MKPFVDERDRNGKENDMRTKHQKTLEAIYADPTRANILFEAIKALMLSLGADFEEGGGSRVRFILMGDDFTMHRPHPQKEVKKPYIRGLREFLQQHGITP